MHGKQEDRGCNSIKSSRVRLACGPVGKSVAQAKLPGTAAALVESGDRTVAREVGRDAIPAAPLEDEMVEAQYKMLEPEREAGRKAGALGVD
ncbi:hypothetical protein Dda_7867 [Drechslerella dactyloides]|uniref:Uncharacterized protein n=1 Tax=Drechslerella dactyloides TaxID=74499 RepID=A0AAD6IS82_DREDA|nr:hypothetical protein Dda_7867 [Drechslerella dactyloides]